MDDKRESLRVEMRAFIDRVLQGDVRNPQELAILPDVINIYIDLVFRV